MRSTLLGLLLLAIVAVAAAHDDGPICTTPELTEEERDEVDNIMAEFKRNVCPKVSTAVNLPFCGTGRAKNTIPVIWNILIDPTTGLGNISDETIVRQMEIMNEDYAGRQGKGYETNWGFKLKSINRIENERWFNNMIALESQFKPQLAQDPSLNLHIYTGNMNAGVLGMCYFAFMYRPSDPMHGCLVNHVAVVGGGLPPYDGGQTAVHEVGHHLGLYHVWQAGCSERSDRVDDTPPQDTNSRGCPDPVPQSCTPGLYDNIHNHMDYSDDACRYMFTKGQSDRTDEVIATFHPGYLSAEQRRAIRAAVPNAWDNAIAFQRRMSVKYEAHRHGL